MSEQPKQLVRSSSNKMIGGVASGMAQYFNMDVNLMRILWALVGVFTFPVGVIAYFVLMFVLPEGQ
jgi:phage shock protein C